MKQRRVVLLEEKDEFFLVDNTSGTPGGHPGEIEIPEEDYLEYLDVMDQWRKQQDWLLELKLEKEKSAK